MPFSTYMDWVLQDPIHGYYGSGQVVFGVRGDFVTASSLGPTLPRLLLPQLLQCFDVLATTTSEDLALVEWGPGDGELSRELGVLLAQERPQWQQRLQLLLVETSPLLQKRQAHHLQQQPLPWRHCSPATLASAPVHGVLMANELLDALPVERFTRGDDGWHWQWVSCSSGHLAWQLGPLLPPEVLHLLETVGVQLAQDAFAQGWSSEIALSHGQWCKAAAAALQRGWVWCMDYGHSAQRYYSPQRGDGTLMAYGGQQAMGSPFCCPGQMDITAHICTDLVRHWAEAAGLHTCGEVSQGQGLLALGLAKQLGQLSQRDGPPLAQRLARREALLRLVDPAGLGGFRWLFFRRGIHDPGPGGLVALGEPATAEG